MYIIFFIGYCVLFNSLLFCRRYNDKPSSMNANNARTSNLQYRKAASYILCSFKTLVKVAVQALVDFVVKKKDFWLQTFQIQTDPFISTDRFAESSETRIDNVEIVDDIVTTIDLFRIGFSKRPSQRSKELLFYFE